MSPTPLAPLPLTSVRFHGGFWGQRLRTNREITLPLVWEHLRRSGRIAAFDLRWRPGRPRPPHVFWDSDVAKWVEAASYSLATDPDPVLQRRVDAVVRRIVAAQQSDGYLNTYFTTVAPDQRWRNLRDLHELYCAGHLIEAGVARAEAAEKTDLLHAVCRYADLIARTFGRGRKQKRGYPGHQEIELALARLHRVTNEPRYLDLARYFLDERGRKPHYFDREARARGEDPRAWRFGNYEYNQSHLPVRDQRKAVGHAVRALYMFSAMADVGVATADRGLMGACKRLWENVAQRRMYLTGGIGSSAANEGFTHDFDLPDEHGYFETCASIAFVFFSHRMLQITRDSRYADAMERALMNGVLSAVSLDGERFFYSNPLASHDPDPHHRNPSPQIWDGPSLHREDWFGCACCPPNITRLLASLGRYAVSADERGLWIHLYADASLVCEAFDEPIVLRQHTDYPWDGEVELEFETAPEREFSLCLRIPDWTPRARLWVAGTPVPVDPITRRGYVHVRRRWAPGDRVRLQLAMPVQRVRAHPSVRHAAGRLALQRGPLVYCLESVDNGIEPLDRIALPARGQLRTATDSRLRGMVVIEGEATATQSEGWSKTLYREVRHATHPVPFRAVPYCLWDNRKPGSMRVWLREER